MIVFTIFVVVGILLFINDHRWWGALCFLIALVDLIFLAL